MTCDPKRAWAAVALMLAACTPALNWREVRPEESELVALFPCRPEQVARTVPLAGARVQMHLASCAVDDVVYAISHAALDTPAQASLAMEQLSAAAAANIGGRPSGTTPMVVNGMTPNERAQRFSTQGQSARGQAVIEQVGVFSKGLRVYQATIVGPRIDAEAADTFFGGLKLPA